MFTLYECYSFLIVVDLFLFNDRVRDLSRQDSPKLTGYVEHGNIFTINAVFNHHDPRLAVNETQERAV
jgi:hypothetical protein